MSLGLELPFKLVWFCNSKPASRTVVLGVWGCWKGLCGPKADSEGVQTRDMGMLA